MDIIYSMEELGEEVERLRLERIAKALDGQLPLQGLIMYGPGWKGDVAVAVAEIGADFRNALGWAGNGHRWTHSANSAETDYWPSD